MLAGLNAILSQGRRPPLAVGVMVAAILVGLCTGAVYPLKQVTTVSSLGIVYLLGVLVVSAVWGLCSASQLLY